MPAQRLVVTRGALADPRGQNRVAALLARWEGPAVEVIEDHELTGILASLGPRQALERGGLRRRGAGKELVALGRLAGGEEVFPGYSWREVRDARFQAGSNEVLCHTAIEIQTAVGCPFDCAYCPYTTFLAVCVDVEAIAARVVDLVRHHPEQSLYKLNNRTDTLGLEPAYGLARVMIERFAELDAATLMLYSKGAWVEHLLDLDHRGRTIGCFTLTPEAVARRLELGAPSPTARIGAMGRMGAAGYPIRVRLSPLVPMRGWRQAYRELIAQIVRVATPELWTLWSLSMIDFEDLPRIVPLDLLDDEAYEVAEIAAESMRGTKGAPFPPALRAQMYREVAALIREASPAAQISLCLETPRVWDEVGALLVQREGTRFRCNCAPDLAEPSSACHGDV